MAPEHHCAKYSAKTLYVLSQQPYDGHSYYLHLTDKKLRLFSRESNFLKLVVGSIAGIPTNWTKYQQILGLLIDKVLN